MAAGETQASWGIAIPVETNAAEAADELENLRDQLTADTQTLRNMQKAMRDLQGGTNVSIQTFRKLREGIAAQKIAVAQGTQSLSQHKDAFKSLTPAQAKATQGTKEYRAEQEKLAKTRNSEFASGLAHALGVLSPRLGHGLRATQDFNDGLKTMGAMRGVAVGALTAIAAATALVVYGLTKAIKSLGEFGVAAADARREERLMLQSASATLWWGQATEFAGQQAQLAVDKVTRAVPLARAEVAGYAKQLATAQLKGQNLEKALKAVSIAASAGQDTSGLIGAFAMMRYGVGSVDALADRIEKRFGHIARARMLSLDVQVMKLKENFAGLFSKVNVTPFLEGLQKIFALFDRSTVAGYAMRETLTAIFDVLGKDFKDATPTIEKMMKMLLIGVLQGALAFVKLRREVMAFLSSSTAIFAFKSLLVGIGTVVGTIAVAFALVGAAVIATVKAFEGLYAAISWFVDTDFAEIGLNWVEGIINGIGRGWEKLKNAIKDLGHKAVEAFRNVWQVHSPSELTKNIADRGFVQGAVVGLRQGQPRVQDAMREVFTPANDVGNPPAPVAAPRARGGRGPVTIQINVTVPPGTTNPEAFGRAVGKGMKDELGDILEEMAHAAGAQLEDDNADAA